MVEQVKRDNDIRASGRDSQRERWMYRYKIYDYYCVVLALQYFAKIIYYILASICYCVSHTIYEYFVCLLY